MTTVITRLYPDKASADAVAAALAARDHDPDTVEIISGGDADAQAAAMKAARVGQAAAMAYAPGLAGGGALLVVRAPFAPMGTARDAINTVNHFPSVKVGLDTEDAYIREEPQVRIAGNVLTSHPLFMTRPGSIGSGRTIAGGRVTAGRTRNSAMHGGGFMSTKILPFRLLSDKGQRSSAIRGGKLMMRMFGAPLMPPGWTISGLFGIPTIIR